MNEMVLNQLPLPLYWWRRWGSQSPLGQGNFGDELAPWIVGRISGRECSWTNRPGKLLTIGSIAAAAQDDDVIWGSGSLSPDVRPRGSNIRVLAVRGPLTRAALQRAGIACPEVYGDPAWLVPELFPEIQPQSSHEVGLVPHWCDIEAAHRLFGNRDDLRIISSLRPWREVLSQIARCRAILSSSLHGLILADTWGIPSRYVAIQSLTSERQRAQGRAPFKFADYFASVNRSFTEPILLASDTNLPRVVAGCVVAPRLIAVDRLRAALGQHVT